MWSTLAYRFLLCPSDLTSSHLQPVNSTPLSLHEHLHITGDDLIACGILCLWKAHWRCILDDLPLRPNEVAARTTQMFCRIHNQNQFAKTRSVQLSALGYFL
jgi:hypothetical protein